MGAAAAGQTVEQSAGQKVAAAEAAEGTPDRPALKRHRAEVRMVLSRRRSRRLALRYAAWVWGRRRDARGCGNLLAPDSGRLSLGHAPGSRLTGRHRCCWSSSALTFQPPEFIGSTAPNWVRTAVCAAGGRGGRRQGRGGGGAGQRAGQARARGQRAGGQGGAALQGGWVGLTWRGAQCTTTWGGAGGENPRSKALPSPGLLCEHHVFRTALSMPATQAGEELNALLAAQVGAAPSRPARRRGL